MFVQYEEQIRREATAAFPNEAVWLITTKGCRQVENIHADPENHFEVRQLDLAKARAEGLLAVVHSHPNMPDVPSACDMQAQINNAVPFGILTSGAEGSGKIRWWGMEARPPLLGRPFVHGITDCYALIRDYYHMTLGIELPEFPRDWMWWEEGQSLFTDGFEEAGFRQIRTTDLREHDVVLFRIRADEVNHGGVMQAGELFLHQIGSPGSPVDHSRPSAREPVHRYMPFLSHALRHKDLE